MCHNLIHHVPHAAHAARWETPRHDIDRWAAAVQRTRWCAFEALRSIEIEHGPMDDEWWGCYLSKTVEISGECLSRGIPTMKKTTPFLFLTPRSTTRFHKDACFIEKLWVYASRGHFHHLRVKSTESSKTFKNPLKDIKKGFERSCDISATDTCRCIQDGTNGK